jgi:hypothetical protein
MYMELGNDLRITTDEFQFMLQKKSIVQATPEGSKKKKTLEKNIGNIVWITIAYCSSLDQALRHVGRNIVLKNDDLKVIKEKLTELENTISKFTGIFEIEVNFSDEEN